jgi:Ca2+-binding RTX toxin-like protein
MSYLFGVAEQAKILDIVSEVDGVAFVAGDKEYQAVNSKKNNCAPFYKLLSDILGEKLSNRVILDGEVISDLESAKLWLDVAFDANGGSGVYSALIRAYTLRQGKLRLNETFDDDLMQEASNAVAANFINALLEGSVEDNLAPWTLPSIDQIASIDARAVGEVLFLKKLGKEDTASSRNAGWSGTIAFSLLGGDWPYETWRLISAGDPGSELKGNHGKAKVNRLDDYKNILFAIDSYSAALKAVGKNFGWNIFDSLFSVIPEQINVALYSGNINPLIQYVVKGTPISSTVDLILRYGVNAFLDMLGRTYGGNSSFVPTTDETFAANAYAFFSELTADQSQSIVAKTIGEYGSASAWGKLAAEETSIALALRNALKYLSEIVIERDDGFPGRRLELYDPQTGAGVLTEQWLFDRAGMLGRLIARSNGSFGENTIQAYSYSDLASGRQAPMSTGVSNPLVIFGDDEGRSLSGVSNKDHLYGGAGDDTVSGFSGNDYIEGGDGNDSLTGGDGHDALHGMSGDDILVGGKGNDILMGGAGNDRYEFSTGDGLDQIFDLDANGQILINGVAVSVAQRIGPMSNVWITHDGATTLTLTDGATDKTLTIRYGQNDQILIKNYKPGILGIQLSDHLGDSSLAPALTIVGDLQAIDADSSIPGDQFSYDDLGNVVVRPDVSEGNRADLLYGSPNDDVIIGGGGSDQIFGKAGNDSLFGDQRSTIEAAIAGATRQGDGSRGDWLDGGQGDDLLLGTTAKDVLFGGNGSDTLIGGAGDDNLSGDDVTGALSENWDFERINVPLGNDVVSVRNVYSNASSVSPGEGEGGNDVLYGQGGRDFLNGQWGDDLLDGGTEDDVLGGDGGNDTLRGGDGNDTLLGDNLDWAGGLRSRHHGNDLLDGGNGNDVLAGNGGSDVLFGGAGNDKLTGDDPVLQGVDGDAADYFGNDFLDGGAGDDTLQGGGADDTLYGGAGNDVLTGDYANHPTSYHGNDFLDGGMGDDTLLGMGGSDTLIGGEGADRLDGDIRDLEAGGINDDYIEGNAGNDVIWGGLGADTLYGGADDDYLEGDYVNSPETGHGADYLNGGSGNDTLVGGGGNDTLVGGSGADHLRGGSGDNVFEGGNGNDYLEGQDGDDTFHFGTGDGLDVIVDKGGNNVLKFGTGFSANELKVDIIVVDVGPVLRLSNGLGDAILIRDFQMWSDSSFSFIDGSVLNFKDIMSIVEDPKNIAGSQSAKTTLRGGADDKFAELAGNNVVTDHVINNNDKPIGDVSVVDFLEGGRALEATDDTLWDREFIIKAIERRTALRLASTGILNKEGDWTNTFVSNDRYNYDEKTYIKKEGFQVGTFSEAPSWMKSDSGQAVISARSSESTTRNEKRSIVAGGDKTASAKAPRYYRSGSSHSGFSLSAGDVVVEDKNESGVIQGWYVYPAGSFAGGNGETYHRDYSWNTTVETIRHQVVQGNDAGGRVNIETGNIFHGGAGDDLIVTYINPTIRYGNRADRVPGALLSGGAGNDTLLGSEGADYLISGSGNDCLYGENGQDTYVIGKHAGATTIIVDMLSPVFQRGAAFVGWEVDFHGRNDQDTVTLPDGASLQTLQLNWGTALIEAVNTELDPKSRRSTGRIVPRGQMLYTTLDISWGTNQKVRIVMPNSADPTGSGIETIKFSDGSIIDLEVLVANGKLGRSPDTYSQSILIVNAQAINSSRDNKLLPLVGGRGDDILSGNGEIRGMPGDDLVSGGIGDDVLWGGPGNDTLSGGAGNDVYKYDGLGKDVVVNASGGNDGIDFTEVRMSISDLRFHRDNNDLVIMVNLGTSPKIRVANHFSGGESAISYIRVQEQGRAKDYLASQLVDLLHPMPPPEDIDSIVLLGGEDASHAITQMIKFYGLDG